MNMIERDHHMSGHTKTDLAIAGSLRNQNPQHPSTKMSWGWNKVYDLQRRLTKVIVHPRQYRAGSQVAL